jgi:DNA polymerase-3 subunit delta
LKLRVDQIAQHLQGGLKPVYLLSGDEALQMMEVSDAIRRAARAAGYSDRQVLEVDSSFDWRDLGGLSSNLSLFAELKLIDLRIPTGKPGRDGAAALGDYCNNLPADTILLISSGKLDAAQTKSKWYQTIEKVGATVQIWPVDIGQLPQWIVQRARALGFDLSVDAAQLLSERVEGNLLACAQELEKLKLLYPQQAQLGFDEVDQASGESSRYNIFTLVDAALAGERARVCRIMSGLEGEGVEPVQVAWALDREIRMMATISEAVARGERPEQAMTQQHVWQKRKPLVQAGLQRHPVKRWRQLQLRMGRLDRLIKSSEQGNSWDELLQLSLIIAGIRVV